MPAVEPEKRKPGRPPKAEKQIGRKAELDAAVDAHMPQVWLNLKTLADGKAERVDEVWEPAGLQVRKDVAREKDGTVIRDKNLKPIVVEVPMFPDVPPETLMLVERKVTKLPVDFKANEYAWNRHAGRPAESKDDDDDDGLKMRDAIEEAEELLRGLPGGVAVWPIASDDAEAEEAAADE